MNRAELQTLAETRVEDARVLLEAGRWSGAYYLIGYAVKCALKAAVAKRTKEFDFPDRKMANSAWTHRPGDLLALAEQKPPQNRAMLEKNWHRVRDWNEGSRYDLRSELEARDLFQAVNDPDNGVLQWIRKFWYENISRLAGGWSAGLAFMGFPSSAHTGLKTTSGTIGG